MSPLDQEVIMNSMHETPTMLEALCWAHKQQGGTVHQFNAQYGVDFLLAKPIGPNKGFFCRRTKNTRDVLFIGTSGHGSVVSVPHGRIVCRNNHLPEALAPN